MSHVCPLKLTLPKFLLLSTGIQFILGGYCFFVNFFVGGVGVGGHPKVLECRKWTIKFNIFWSLRYYRKQKAYSCKFSEVDSHRSRTGRNSSCIDFHTHTHRTTLWFILKFCCTSVSVQNIRAHLICSCNFTSDQYKLLKVFTVVIKLIFGTLWTCSQKGDKNHKCYVA